MTQELRRRWLHAAGPPLLLLLIVVLPRLCAAAFVVTPARDMVRYVEAAEALQTLPLADALRSMDCHPLYPAALLGARSVISTAFGFTGPTAWVTAGEVVGVGCYVLFILTAFAVGGRLWDRTTAFWGCAIVALVPRQVSYTVDVLTDSLHAWLWMTSAWFLMGVDRPNPSRRYALAGVFAALAYWTRSEAVLLPAMAALGLLMIQLAPTWRLSWRTTASCAATFGVCWAILTGAYMATIGRASPRLVVAAFTGKITIPESVVPSSEGLLNVGGSAVPRPEGLPAEPAHAGSSLNLTPRPYERDEAYEFRSLSRAILSLGYEISQETRVWMLPFAAWGLLLSGATFRRPSSVFFVIAWLGYSAILILLQMKCGYIAGRYLMPVMPLIGMAAVVGMAAFLRLAVRRPPWAERLLQRINADRLAPSTIGRIVTALVVLMAFATCAPAWFRSNHRYRQTYLQAASWLKEHTPDGEAVFDPARLVSFYANRPNWLPSQPAEPIPVRYAVVDVERVYRTDPVTHSAIRRFGAEGRVAAYFVQAKSHREGIVYILELAPATSTRKPEGGLR